MNPPVCLVIPPSIFLCDERVFPSLGVLKVAASLERYGYSVVVLDLSGVANYEERAAQVARVNPHMVFGFTSTTPQLPACIKAVAAVKAVNSSTRTILGGSHVTMVNAALKRAMRLGRPNRAERHYLDLADRFDVLVAGDGELAMIDAIYTEQKLLDADIPTSKYWIGAEELEDLLPARHLIDMDSYHYEIDGHRATSLVGQLGCLAEGSQIMVTDGSVCPIEQICRGMSVVAYDSTRQQLVESPVAETSRRHASDLWEIKTESGEILKATGEHPILTEHGWRNLNEIKIGDCIASVQQVRSRFHGGVLSESHGEILQRGLQEEALPVGVHSVQQGIRGCCSTTERGQVLLPGVQMGVAETSLPREMVKGRSDGHETQMESDDPGREGQEVKYRDTKGCGTNSTGKEVAIRDKAWRPQSHETSRSSGKSVPDDEVQMGEEDLRLEEGHAKRSPILVSMASRADISGSEQNGADAESNPGDRSSNLQVCGEWSILDRPVQIWKAEESRLYRPYQEAGHPSKRRILAQRDGRRDRDCGLSIQRMESNDRVVPGDEAEAPRGTFVQNREIHYVRVCSKRFIGASEVFNITVCPNHSYVAQGIVVHNCPMACSFCSGRYSPMLRRIRQRSVESILNEVATIHHTYGYTGVMFYDDEINVNREMLNLMDGLYLLQRQLGVSMAFRGCIKAELFTEQQAQAMALAGFKWILVGFEAGHDRILTNINKKATIEDNNRCMALARKHGLKVKALMSIGHPGESQETAWSVKDWLLKVKPDDFNVTIITTTPGSPYYDDAVQSGTMWVYTAANGDRLWMQDIDYTVVADYYNGRPGEYRSYVETDYLSSEDLVSIRDRIERAVRAELKIPFSRPNPYDRSMGQIAMP